jgi:HK97 family phage major capsid protein
MFAMPVLEEKNIREKRAEVWSGMAAIIEAAKSEDRVLTDSEAAEYDKRSEELSGLDADLKRVQKYDQESQAVKDIAENRGVSADENLSRADLETRAFSQYLKRGPERVDQKLRPYLAGSAEFRAPEYDAGLQTGGFGPGGSYTDGTVGGYLVPTGFWQNLTIALKAFGGLLNVANIVDTATGNPMNWPTTDPTGFKGGIIGETVGDSFGPPVPGGSTYSFGQGTLQAWTYTSGVILASVELINDSAFDIDQFIRDRVGESIGRAVADHLVTGTGTGQPLGIQTALVAKGAAGVGTGGVYTPASDGTVSVFGNTAGVPKSTGGYVGFDDILGLIRSVDPAYRALGNCTWAMSDTTLQNLRATTDNYGRPLWEPNVQVNGNDNLYGYPVLIDQNIGTVSTTAETPGGLMFGDFSRAMVVRRVNQAEVMRLVERYADARQVGYAGFIRMDARSNDLRAAAVYGTPAEAE